MKIKFILFDNNGVLTTNHKENVDADMARVAGVSIKKMHFAVLKHCVPLDTGKISDLEFSKRVLKTVKSQISPQLLSKTRLNGYHPKREVIKFAKKLSKVHKIGLLSNFGKSFHRAEKKWKLSKLFNKKRMFISYKLHMCKPNKNIYRKVTKNLGCKPCEIVFIDDSWENVKGARKFGINAIHFKSISLLKKELIKYDIKC
jgi:HAD superfamily hydrolase (TIGR01509 family)